jgi:hypothetical protein
MPSNEEFYEEVGWKAHNRGIFDEWQAKTSSLLDENPDLERSEAAYRIYKQLVGSQNENDRSRENI